MSTPLCRQERKEEERKKEEKKAQKKYKHNVNQSYKETRRIEKDMTLKILKVQAGSASFLW